MAALDVGTALANLKTMLSGLAAWQSICGVSSSTEAAKRIHYGATELDPEEQEGSENPCIVLDITSLSTTWRANRLHGTAIFEMRFYLEMPDAEKQSYSTQYIWVWQKFSAMLDAVNSAVAGSGQAMIKNLDVPLMPGRIDPDNNGGGSEWNFVISMGVDFI
jgi:hypothetical protein